MELTYGMPGELEPVLNVAFRQPHLLVNLLGERFMDEGVMHNTTFTGNAISVQNDKTAFCIFEEKIKTKMETKGFDSVSMVFPMLKAEKIDLNDLVKGVIDLLAVPDNIKITIEDKLPEYTANRTRLTEVFQNLLSNPIKYIDKPEGIIKISCTDEGNEWKFGITDNGPGIEEKNFEKIFKIFQMLDAKPSDQSTGIGLTIVKKIIDLYKGRIWVESEKGKGTTFYFTLPKR